MKQSLKSNMFDKADSVRANERPVKAFLIKGSSEEARLETAQKIIRNVIKTHGRWVYGCYSGENKLALILTRDPSYLWAMTFQEAKERAEQDEETIEAGLAPSL